MAEKKIQFNQSGAEILGEVVAETFIGEQRWFDVRVAGVRWAVPQGWPNNSSPICEESEPEAYSEIFG